MAFQPGAVVNTQSFGNRPENVEVPHIDNRAPTSSDNNYPIGKRWVDTVAGNEYSLTSIVIISDVNSANWAFLGSSSGDLNSLTTDDATVVTPTGGTIIVTGNATQGVSTTGSNTPGTVTVTVADWTTSQKGVGVLASDAQAIAGTGTTQAVTPHALQAKIGTQTAHGVAMGNTGATSALSYSSAGTSGQAFISGGAGADGAYGTLGVPGGGTGLATLTAHALYVGNGTSAPTALAVGATGETVMGATGADPAWSGSPSYSGSVTAATTITATLGDITATNGNVVLGTAGNKLVIATGSNASVGTSSAMAGTPGAVVVATTACSASAKVFYSRNVTGGTMGNVSITAQDGTGFTLTSDANETSTFNWWIINS